MRITYQQFWVVRDNAGRIIVGWIALSKAIDSLLLQPASAGCDMQQELHELVIVDRFPVMPDWYGLNQ